jgi:hypothetical protein
MYNRDMPVNKPQFFHRLNEFSDDQLLALTRRYLRLSGEAADRPRSFYHQFLFRIHSEWERRGKVAVFDATAREIRGLGGGVD